MVINLQLRRAIAKQAVGCFEYFNSLLEAAPSRSLFQIAAGNRYYKLGMSVTQQDIADHLEISLITVHRALHNSGYVSTELKERILAYAKEVNYVPHKASQVLVRNKTRKIAVFTSSLPHYFWNEIKTGVMVGAEQSSLQLSGALPKGPRAGFASLSRSSGKGVRRRIRGGSPRQPMDLRHGRDPVRIDRAGIPYVTLNVDAPGSRRRCFIGPDYAAGGRLAAEFIGKALQFKDGPRALVINALAQKKAESAAPDINKLRFDGFSEVMREDFPRIECVADFSTTDRSEQDRGSDRADAQREEGRVQRDLPRPGLQRAVRPDHREDWLRPGRHRPARPRYLVLPLPGESLISAVIYQNPIWRAIHRKILETS